MPEKIINVNGIDQFVDDYRKYGLYVLYRRVMADIRDGLKPVHRKILYSMFNDKKAYGPSSNKIKSASVVGTVLEKYHPHGDAAVYGSMKPMINWFECKYPLITGYSNFGNFQGDPAAAYRYTECKLSDFAMDCILGDLLRCKECVDWVPTFDGRSLEPEYLPVKLPLLLINGSFGIGVGDKAEIPSHSLSDVIDATIAIMDNPDAKISLAPDHCMPCNIFKTKFDEISRKGFGYYYIRGIIDIEQYSSKRYKNRTALIIKSIPDLIFLDTITSAIDKLVEKKQLVQIERCFDESTNDDMRYVIILKQGVDPEYVREVIYKNTAMEARQRVNMECIYGTEPLRLSYSAYIKAFIDMRKLTLFRIYANELQKIDTSIHKREAFVKLLESGMIDTVIDMIKKSKGTDDASLVEFLITKLKITDLQASYIINANLKKLSKGYLEKYRNELSELNAQVASIYPKLSDDNLIEQEIRNELLAIKAKYGIRRKCSIIKDPKTAQIPEGTMIVYVTQGGFIKKTLSSVPLGAFRGDIITNSIIIENTDTVLLFDSTGKVVKIPVHKIPFGDKSSNGIYITHLLKGYVPLNIVSVQSENTIISLNDDFRDTPNQHSIIAISECGYTKRLDLIDFTNIGSSGLIYSKVSTDDKIQDVLLTNATTDIMVYSDKKAVRVRASDIPLQMRNTRGSKLINADHVDGICVIDNMCGASSIIVVTEKGKINKLPINGIPSNINDKKGFNVIKLSNDKIFRIMVCMESNIYRLTTHSGNIMDIQVSEVPTGSSVSTGIKSIGTARDTISTVQLIRY